MFHEQLIITWGQNKWVCVWGLFISRVVLARAERARELFEPYFMFKARACTLRAFRALEPFEPSRSSQLLYVVITFFNQFLG